MERTNEKIKVPIKAKIRSGIRGKAVAVKIAKICEESGASAICVHPRTREQGYSGKADWKIIKNVKDAVSIPVIGNGDIKKPEDAKRMLQQTGCDYVMIGRAARGNPFIFKQINDFLDRGTYDELSDKEKLKIFLEYVNLAHQHKLSFVDIKMQAAYFTKGLPDSNVLRNRLMKTRSIQEIKSLLSN